MPERKLGALICALRNGDMLLPNFQRRFVWDPDRWQAFMASLLLDYPTGILLVGTKLDSHSMAASKPFSIPDRQMRAAFLKRGGLSEAEMRRATFKASMDILTKAKAFECEYLLDGQQRLTSVDLVIGNAFHHAEGHEIWPRVRWFLELDGLGFKTLTFPDLKSLSHEDAKRLFVGEKYRKTDAISPFHLEKADDELIRYCQQPHKSVRLPMDRLFQERSDKSGMDLDADFFSLFFSDHRRPLCRLTNRGAEIEAQKLKKAEKERQYQSLESQLDKWRMQLEKHLRALIESKLSVYELTSQDFDRLAGIFSVINLSPVALSTFDLLLAMTSEPERNIRTSFQKTVSEAATEFRESASLIPSGAKGQGEDPVEGFWSLAAFLGEKAAAEVDAGEEYPDAISKQLAQVITLHSRLTAAFGSDWAKRKKLFKSFPKAKETVAALLSEEGWTFSDRQILKLSRKEVHGAECQAAKQLLRAYFFIQARLGIQKLSGLPYRLMDLPLACVLTDTVWKTIVADPNGKCARKLIAWFWASIFGGAYKEGQDKRVLSDIPRLLVYLDTDEVRWIDLYKLGAADSSAALLVEDAVGRNRMAAILDVPGYSDARTLMEGWSDAIAKAIRGYELARCPRDFKAGAERPKQRLHAGRRDVQGDHLFALAAWKKFTGHSVSRTDYEHPLNSPLNATVISGAANRHWSDDPLFLKVELADAVSGNLESRDFLADHFLSVETIAESADTLKSAKMGCEKAEEIVRGLLERRHEILRQHLREFCKSAGEG